MFCGPVRVPSNADHDFADIQLSMPDWPEGNVTPGAIRGLIIGESRDTPGIAAALKSSTTVARKEIIDAVGRFGPFDTGTAKMLIEQTHDENQIVRSRALWTLARFAQQRELIKPEVLKLLKDPAESVRSTALRILPRFESDLEESLPAFINATSDESLSVRRVAVHELGTKWASEDGVLEVLMKSLDDEDAYIRKYAARGLGLSEGQTDTSFAGIANLLKDDEKKVRSYATTAIIKRHSDRIDEVLESLGDSANELDVKATLACEALKRQGAEIQLLHGKATSLKLQNKTDISATDLRYASELKDLKSFIIYSCPVGDEIVSHLMSLPKLEYVVLWNSAITDRAVKQLSAKSSVERLGIGGNSKITDAAMTSIKNMPQLTLLSLGYTPVSDEGLKSVAELTNLKFLGVAETKITDEGLMNLKSLTSLTQLNIFGNQITSSGLQHITHLKQLKILDIHKTSVNDMAIDHIAKLQALTHLNAKETKVTAAGAAKIRTAIPLCNVTIQ